MCTRTTMRSIKSNYNCYSVGYCELYYLLRHLEPEHYTAGACGWNADIYIIGNSAIVTGYRPFGKKVNHSLCKGYDAKAKQILKSGNNYNKILNQLEMLLKELIINVN